MGDGLTRPLPYPRRGPFPGPLPRRGSRRALTVFVILLALAGLLAAVDRVAALYADHRIAAQLESHGFPSNTTATVEGFPFLTQVVSRDLQGVEVRSSGLREGPVAVSLKVLASNIRLDTGYSGGAIGRVNGAGLIPFSSIATAAGAAGAPGLTLSAGGRRRVRLTAHLQVMSATAIAAIKQTGPDTFKINIVSANGLPTSLLGPLQRFIVHVPPLPLGLAIQSVTVSGQGVVIHLTGAHIPFGH